LTAQKTPSRAESAKEKTKNKPILDNGYCR
jgi:hypothetical protein